MKGTLRLLAFRDVVVIVGLACYGTGRYMESPARMLVELGVILLTVGLFKYAVDAVVRMRGTR